MDFRWEEKEIQISCIRNPGGSVHRVVSPWALLWGQLGGPQEYTVLYSGNLEFMCLCSDDSDQ